MPAARRSAATVRSSCPRRRTRRRRSAASTCRRCPRGSTSNARRRATSPARRPAARPKPASRERARPACSISICSAGSSTRPDRRSCASTSSTTARRSCTSARVEMCEYIKTRSRTSISTRAPTASPSAKTQVRRLVRSGIDEVTFSIDGATAGELCRVSAARRLPQSDPEPAERSRRKALRRTRPAVPQLALHPLHAQRQRGGDAAGAGDGRRDRRRSPLLGADRSSREHVLAAVRSGAADRAAIKHEVWDDNNLGNAIPGATPRRRIAVGRRPSRRGRLDRRASGGRESRQPVRMTPRCGTSRRAPSPLRPATAGGSSASARSSATATAT